MNLTRVIQQYFAIAFDWVSSRVQYPPMYNEPPRANAIKTATLIYRNDASTTALSVKDCLLPLGGHMGDFHRNSEYQLKKKSARGRIGAGNCVLGAGQPFFVQFRWFVRKHGIKPDNVGPPRV